NAKRTMFNLFRSGRSIFVGDGATNRKSHSKRQENYYHAQVIETKKVTAFFVWSVCSRYEESESSGDEMRSPGDLSPSSRRHGLGEGTRSRCCSYRQVASGPEKEQIHSRIRRQALSLAVLLAVR